MRLNTSIPFVPGKANRPGVFGSPGRRGVRGPSRGSSGIALSMELRRKAAGEAGGRQAFQIARILACHGTCETLLVGRRFAIIPAAATVAATVFTSRDAGGGRWFARG